jgi:rubredoxin
MDDDCPRCGGTGVVSDAPVGITCPKCLGTGKR